MIAKEKAEFDTKIRKGRFATVCKNQSFYKDVIATVEKADQHMKQTI